MASVLNKGQIWTEIKAHLGNRSDVDDRKNTVLLLAINHIARMHEFDELRFVGDYQTTFSGVAETDRKIDLLALPQGANKIRKIYSIRLWDGHESRKLRKLNARRFDEILPKPDVQSRGKPTHYCLYNKNTIELWRVPDAVYDVKIRCSLYPEFPSEDDDTFVFDTCDDLIIFLGASYLALSAGNVQRANELYRAFANAAVQVLNEEVEDFDTFQAVHGTEIRNPVSTGYDDPFVRSIEDYT